MTFKPVDDVAVYKPPVPPTKPRATSAPRPKPTPQVLPVYVPPVYYEVDHLVGKTLAVAKRVDEALVFQDATNTYTLEHERECCEEVWIEDICGDLDDLVGSPILRAEKTESEDEEIDYCSRRRWTFYHLWTAKGAVVVRWCGENNGYYSIGVDFNVKPL